MKEIGGYIELDTYHLPMLHDGAIALNCGRNALAYLIRARQIKRLWIPKLICDSITYVCERENTPYTFYNIGMDFLPDREIEIEPGEWLYFVNYYSQFDNDTILWYVNKYKRVIVDQAQSYFQMPIPGVDTLYTCRKYFGVADGAFLYTDVFLEDNFPTDESFARMLFLLGRFERTASEYYMDYVKNNNLFLSEPIKHMSKLTKNLLHGIDYEQKKSIRQHNYSYLHSKLWELNELILCDKGTFMYPFLIKNGSIVRKKLQEKNIYIPVLWPSVYSWCKKDELEYKLAENILPLPIDQRYRQTDMEHIVKTIYETKGD